MRKLECREPREEAEVQVRRPVLYFSPGGVLMVCASVEKGRRGQI